MWYWHKDRPVEQKREPSCRPLHIWPLDKTKMVLQRSGERMNFSVKGSETVGYPYGKWWIWTSTPYHIIINCRWIKDLNVKGKNIELRRYYRGFSLFTAPDVIYLFFILVIFYNENCWAYRKNERSI